MFGIDDTIKDLIVVLFEDEKDEKIKKIKEIIQGNLTDLSELQEVTNWSRIAKLHGINENTQPDNISDLVISKTACKEILL